MRKVRALSQRLHPTKEASRVNAEASIGHLSITIWIWVRRLRATLAVLALVVAAAYVSSGGLPRGAKAQNALATTDSSPLPGIRLVTTLSATHQNYPLLGLVAGASNLTWSQDGQRLAAYVNGGDELMIWSPDGVLRLETPRYNGLYFRAATFSVSCPGIARFLRDQPRRNSPISL